MGRDLDFDFDFDWDLDVDLAISYSWRVWPNSALNVAIVMSFTGSSRGRTVYCVGSHFRD